MYNVVQQNGGGGIYIYEGEINRITNNVFEDNQNFNARDNGQTNWWFTNFYSDYLGRNDNGIGIDPYAIQGRRGAVTFDLHPAALRTVAGGGGRWERG